MIAIDTNILVYSHRADSPWHSVAKLAVKTLAEGKRSCAIPWPCVHEFLAVATHPKIYDPPSTAKQAIEQVDAWLESPKLVLIAEAADHWLTLAQQINAGQISGPMVHDARVAAICLEHGVSELWSVDRDFSRFPNLRVRNPLVDEI